MESLKEEGNGYIRISGFKGIWTLEEVIELLHQAGFKVKIVMSTKEEDRLIKREESSNQVVKEVR
jgi:3-polyprenyl-4-hydroxybenzoate decarboxylase